MGIPENIDALLVKFDIKPETLARVAGVTPATVSRWRHGSQIRQSTVERICEEMHVTEDDILSTAYGLAAQEHGALTQGRWKSATVVPSGEVRVPVHVIGHVHAGDVEDEDESDLTVAIAPSVLDGHPDALGLVVDGDCMNNVIPEGYIALYDPDREPRNGQVVIAEIEPGRAVMRRWMRGSHTLMLVADSTEDHEDIVLTSAEAQVRVLGVVFHACTPEGWEA